MSDIRTLTFDEIESLATKALIASNVSAANASAVARSIAAAERDGQAIVGLSYLPTYCDHAACGKVDGHARPRLEHLAAAVLRIDAGTGFAHPAIALGVHPLAEAAWQCGIAALSVGNSYACGSLGYFVEELAGQGLIGIETQRRREVERLAELGGVGDSAEAESAGRWRRQRERGADHEKGQGYAHAIEMVAEKSGCRAVG